MVYTIVIGQVWPAELACPPHSHYKRCGSSCPSSCAGPARPDSCSTPCQDGCQCDPGFVFSGTDCVPPTECGCSTGSNLYVACFDGKSVEFPGTCTSVFTKSCGPFSSWNLGRRRSPAAPVCSLQRCLSRFMGPRFVSRESPDLAEVCLGRGSFG
ncbi:alpha-tectorin-like [Cebus imitator]|uniref:alpha-tectorin-like n=1 Tax=Cebus imitator TaxID=2715852 RepID=UPI0018977AAC|nr:alpha-tectorin-like [Cebus imitator]